MMQDSHGEIQYAHLYIRTSRRGVWRHYVGISSFDDRWMKNYDKWEHRILERASWIKRELQQRNPHTELTVHFTTESMPSIFKRKWK